MGNDISHIILVISQNFQNGAHGAAAILDFGKTAGEKILTPIFQVSVTPPEHKSVIVLLITI